MARLEFNFFLQSEIARSHKLKSCLVSSFRLIPESFSEKSFGCCWDRTRAACVTSRHFYPLRYFLSGLRNLIYVTQAPVFGGLHVPLAHLTSVGTVDIWTHANITLDSKLPSFDILLLITIQGYERGGIFLSLKLRTFVLLRKVSLRKVSLRKVSLRKVSLSVLHSVR